MQWNQVTKTSQIIAIILFVGVFFLGFWIGTKYEKKPHFDDMTACTLDAKICPDGSSVGREGPNCEFAACPGEGVTETIEEVMEGGNESQ